MIYIIIASITLFLVVVYILNRRYALRYRLACLILGTPRERNQKHCYDFPAENNGWKKYGNKPVYGDETTGSIFDPYVYVEDNTFFMCASERKTGSLILLRSADGIHWEKISTMLSGVANTWETIVNRGCVVKKDGKYLLWYTGQQNDCSAIGLAESIDGISFTRKYTHPVLLPTMPIEGKSVMNPCVLWNAQEQLFQMWYSAGEAYEPDVICYAESNDGVNWIKHPVPVLEKYPQHEWEKAKVGGCHVILNEDSTYTIYYIGYQNIDVARICVAQSKDGLRWVRSDNNLLLSPSEGEWDKDAVYKPSAIIKTKEIQLWYNGRNKHNEFIGTALKERI